MTMRHACRELLEEFMTARWPNNLISPVWDANCRLTHDSVLEEGVWVKIG